MTDLIVIETTLGARQDADKLAAALVDQKLAACVQITGPITSTYRWQGQIETSEEWRLSIKTERRYFEAAERAILALHPYEQPEILAFPVIAANAGYEAWVKEMTKDESQMSKE